MLRYGLAAEFGQFGRLAGVGFSKSPCLGFRPRSSGTGGNAVIPRRPAAKGFTGFARDPGNSALPSWPSALRGRCADGREAWTGFEYDVKRQGPRSPQHWRSQTAVLQRRKPVKAELSAVRAPRRRAHLVPFEVLPSSLRRSRPRLPRRRPVALLLHHNSRPYGPAPRTFWTCPNPFS